MAMATSETKLEAAVYYERQPKANAYVFLHEIADQYKACSLITDLHARPLPPGPTILPPNLVVRSHQRRCDRPIERCTPAEAADFNESIYPNTKLA